MTVISDMPATPAQEPIRRASVSARPARAVDRARLQDIIFAAAAVVSLTGINIGSRVPLFAGFVILMLMFNVRRLFNMRRNIALLIPTLVVFCIIHVAGGFRTSTANGVYVTLQLCIPLLFIWPFVSRYSVESMDRYMRYTGIGFFALLMFVIGWHIAHGFFFSWKRLNDAKAVFDVLPLMLVVVKKSQSRSSRWVFPLLLVVSLIAILLSGERKAYILLGLCAPLLLNFRSPITYVTPIALIVAISGVALADKSGYVVRQINTLAGFSEGKVVSTMSNDERAFLIINADKMFQRDPVFGVGTNTYRRTMEGIFHREYGAHNEWMRVAAENGILGLFFYAATLLYGFVTTLRPRVWGRQRSIAERQVALVLFLTCLIYVSFEAVDFIVLLAFCITPFLQFLRLDPRPGQAVRPASTHAAAQPRALHRSRDVAGPGDPEPEAAA